MSEKEYQKKFVKGLFIFLVIVAVFTVAVEAIAFIESGERITLMAIFRIAMGYGVTSLAILIGSLILIDKNEAGKDEVQTDDPL